MRRDRLIIVDDHPLVLHGLEQALETEGFEVVGTATDGTEALALCKSCGVPDLVLCDIRMKEMDGFATLAKLKRNFPEIHVLLLAGMPLKDEMARAQAEGAVGYIPKSLSWNELVSAIRRAIVADEFVNYTLPSRKTGLLTQREETVLKYLNLGKTYDEIAIILGIGRETVKTHIRSLREKLEATSAAGAVGRAYEIGILRA